MASPSHTVAWVWAWDWSSCAWLWLWKKGRFCLVIKLLGTGVGFFKNSPVVLYNITFLMNQRPSSPLSRSFCSTLPAAHFKTFGCRVVGGSLLFSEMSLQRSSSQMPASSLCVIKASFRSYLQGNPWIFPVNQKLKPMFTDIWQVLCIFTRSEACSISDQLC